MPSFNFTSQRPVAIDDNGLLTEFTEDVDLSVPIAIDQVTGLQAALNGAVKLSPTGGATQAVGGYLTLGGSNPVLGFGDLTLYLSTAGSASPANPLAGDAFSSLSALANFVNARLSVTRLTINIAPATYVETAAINFSANSCSKIDFNSSGSVTLDGSAVSGVLLTANQAVSINCPMTLVAATRVWSQTAGLLSVFSATTMTSAALAAAGTLRIGGTGGLGVNNATLTLNQPAGVGACLFAGGTDHYVSGATASIVANKASAHETITMYAGMFRVVSGGKIDTPGSGKTISVGAIVQLSVLATDLLNGATLDYSLVLLATNGWWKDPTTGLVVQWGQSATDAAGTIVQSLPVAFSSAHLIAMAVARATTVGAFTTTGRTTTAFTANSYKLTDGTALSTASFTFLCIGY